MSSFRQLKKAHRKWNDDRKLRPDERRLLLHHIAMGGDRKSKKYGLTIVGDWIDDLIWCPSQCYLKFIHRHRWFVIYLRWRHSNPWQATLCETAVGAFVDDRQPGWNMHHPNYEWIRIPVDEFRDDQLAELKVAVIKEVKQLLLKI